MSRDIINSHLNRPQPDTNIPIAIPTRFESMSFIANILTCKLIIVNNKNWKSISKKI